MYLKNDDVKKKKPYEMTIEEFLRQSEMNKSPIEKFVDDMRRGAYSSTLREPSKTRTVDDILSERGYRSPESIQSVYDAQLNSSPLWEPSYTETVNRDNAAGSSFAINALKSITGMPSKSEEYETGIGYEPLPEIKAPAPKSFYNVGTKYENDPEYVKGIQNALGVKADGIYGQQTRAAVMKFQRDNGLQVDGIAGIQTLGKLFGPTMELGMESKQDAYADTKGLYNYVEPVKPTAIGDDELSLPPNLRKVYEDELRPDISQSVADKKFYQAKPTTNPRAKFRPATIEKRDAYYDDERQKAYEEAVEIARQKGYIDENGNYVGPEDKLKDVILGQAALSWTARAKDAEIGREIMGGKKADTEKYDQRIMDNPQWMVQNPEYVKPYDPEEFLSNPKLALKKTLRDAVDVLSLRLQMLPSGLKGATFGAIGGAGSALALGQAGPQALSPEEAFTVPTAATMGASAGYKIGTGKYMAEMEAGQAYKEYIEDGMDENIARVMAIGAGTTNAWLEEVLGTKLGQIPGLESFLNNAFAKGFMNFLKEAGGEMAEEGAQAAATKTFMEIGKVVDSVINKKPIEGTLLDKESVDGIISGIVQLGARESVQSAPGLIGSMVIGGTGGATTNAARSAIQNVVANKTNSAKNFVKNNSISAINIDDLKNTNLPSDFVWALKQIKLEVPLPNEVTQKYPELIPVINGELSVEEIVNSIDNNQQVQPPLEAVTEQGKTADLNADTSSFDSGAIEKGVIQPKPDIETTEDIEVKHYETQAKVETETAQSGKKDNSDLKNLSNNELKKVIADLRMVDKRETDEAQNRYLAARDELKYRGVKLQNELGKEEVIDKAIGIYYNLPFYKNRAIDKLIEMKDKKGLMSLLKSQGTSGKIIIDGIELYDIYNVKDELHIYDNFSELMDKEGFEKALIKVNLEDVAERLLNKDVSEEVTATGMNKYTDIERKDAVSDEENRIRKEITMNGTAYNNDMSKRVKVQFERTGETQGDMGRLEPIGKYYIEVTADGKLQDVGTTRYDTIEEAQEAAVKALLGKSKIGETSKTKDVKVASKEQPELYRYYLTQRPPGPGTIPKNSANVVSFDTKTYVPEIGREAWGYAEYYDMLVPMDIEGYELIEHPYNDELYKKEIDESEGKPEPPIEQSTEKSKAETPAEQREEFAEEVSEIEKLTNEKIEKGLSSIVSEIRMLRDKIKNEKLKGSNRHDIESRAYELTKRQKVLEGRLSRTIDNPRTNAEKLQNALIEKQFTLDNIEITNPKAKKHGFDIKQRMQIAEELIEGNKTNKHKITIDVDRDGTLNILNNEPVIADVLNELGVKKTEVKIPYGLDKNAGNKVAIDKNNMLAITNGAYAATVTEEEIGALKEFANLNKIDYSDDFDLSRTIIKKDHLKELKETPKVYNANKINYYVFKVEDIFYMFDKKYFDVFNKDGNRFYVSDNNKEAAMIYGNDDEFVGILLPSMKRAGNISKETYDNLNPATGKEFFSKPKANKKVQSSAIIEPLTGKGPQLPQGDDSSTLKETKTVDEIVEIIEKTIDVPIRTGKFRQRAHGIFKTVPEVIRTKVTNDLPTICHEVGHYLDKKFELDDKQFRAELMTLGALASKPSYTPKEVRAEGIAEFVRLYLTDTKEAQNKAPGFYQHFETKLDRDSLVMLNSIRTDILKVVNLSDVDKVINDISIGEKRKTTKQDKSFTGMLQRAYNAWFDEYAPFSTVQKRAKEAGYTGKNVDTAVKLYRGIESKVLNNLEMKQTDLNDNVIGKSYNEIMKPIKKNELSNFRAYMVARRAIDYESRGMVLPQSYAVYFNTLKALEQKHSHFTDVFNDIRTWEDNELQLLVDSGVMSQATVDRIKELNPNHIPLYRIQEAVEIVYGGAGSTLGQSKKVVKRAKGSGKTIIDPLESLVTNAFIIRRAAEANEIIGMLHDMAGTIDGFGDLVEIVPPGIKGFTFNVEEIGKVLQRLLEDNLQADIDERQKKNPNDPMIQILELQKQQIDVKSMDLDKLVTLFRANYKEKDGEVTYYKNGKPVLMQVYPELYKAIKGLNRQASHFLIRMLNVPKRAIQAGAVTTVRFAVWNMSRDTLGSIIQSEAGINPIDILMGYKSALKKDKWYQDWVLSGGATDFLMSSDRAKAQDILYDHVLGYTLIDKLKEALKKPTKENLSRLLFHPINSIRDTVEWSEAGPKVAEFKKLQINEGLTQEEAAKLSREVNQDFLKYGYKGKEYNKITGFFNANLQGDIRVGETFANHPYRTLLRGLIYITLPSMFVYYWNDDNERYKQLASWRKALFYNIPLGNRKTAQRFLPIPRAYGYGLVFGAIPEILLDKLKYDDPKAWERLKEAFILNFNIPSMPSAFSPLWEVRGNKSWNKVPIESVGDKSKPAYLRYNERSSVAAKGIANILKDVPGANKLSPKQIDYLTKGYTGSVGDFFWRIPDTVKNIATDPSDYANYPVVRSFIVDVAYSNRTIDDFYTYGEELNMRLKEAKETGTYRATSHLPEDIQLALVPAIKNATKEYNSVAKGFSDARKAIKEIKANDKFTPAEKKLREREIQFKMIDVADKFNKKYERFKKENNIK